MTDEGPSFFLVKVRATTSYKLAKTKCEQPNRRVTEFRIPLRLVKDFETWRIKLSYQLNKYGFKSTEWGIRLYPTSVRHLIAQIIESSREAYYRLVERIPEEELRRKCSFHAMFAQFMPLEPATSEIIADAMTQAIKDIDRVVNDLITSVNSQKELVARIIMFEDRLAVVLGRVKNEDPIVTWSKEFTIRIARLCALATFNVDNRKARALMLPVAKLRSFMPPFNPSVKSLVEMVYSIVSKMMIDKPLKINDVEKLFEEFLP